MNSLIPTIRTLRCRQCGKEIFGDVLSKDDKGKYTLLRLCQTCHEAGHCAPAETALIPDLLDASEDGGDITVWTIDGAVGIACRPAGEDKVQYIVLNVEIAYLFAEMLRQAAGHAKHWEDNESLP